MDWFSPPRGYMHTVRGGLSPPQNNNKQPPRGPPDGPPAGVGIEFEPSRLAIAKLLPGGSAGHCGELQVGDLLLAVENTAVTNPQQARSRIVGRAGTIVAMTFRRVGKSFTIRIPRGPPPAQQQQPALPPPPSSPSPPHNQTPPRQPLPRMEDRAPLPSRAPSFEHPHNNQLTPQRGGGGGMGGVPPQQAETPSRWETTTLETEVGRLRSKVREVEEEQAAVRERERDLEAELVRQRRDADGLREALVAARESSRQRAGEDGRARAEDVKVCLHPGTCLI